jgi:hypothetical protein
LADDSRFEEVARKYSERGFVREFWSFIRQNKKWWMIPMVVVLLLFGVLIVLSGTGVAPFIYTLF